MLAKIDPIEEKLTSIFIMDLPPQFIRGCADQEKRWQKSNQTDSGSGCLAFDFHGTHLIASYLECDEGALKDVAALRAAFTAATRASGATILERSEHVFPGGGFTCMYLLSESHSSIHTYPEHRSVFVDLFTCGTSCHWQPFDQILKNFLKPQKVSSKVVTRSEDCQFFSENGPGP
ncbi:MAG: adenosylmethionine decarboxylase [Sulfobacillus sp.]